MAHLSQCTSDTLRIIYALCPDQRNLNINQFNASRKFWSGRWCVHHIWARDWSFQPNEISNISSSETREHLNAFHVRPRTPLVNLPSTERGYRFHYGAIVRPVGYSRWHRIENCRSSGHREWKKLLLIWKKELFWSHQLDTMVSNRQTDSLTITWASRISWARFEPDLEITGKAVNSHRAIAN